MTKRNSGNLRLYWLGFLSLVLSVVLYFRLSKTENRPTKMISTNKAAQDLYFYLLEFGFLPQQARFITAQAGHETGDFTSQIYKENNNPFGMKLALVRKTTAVGECYGHANFSSVKSAVQDFRYYYDSWKYLSVYPTIESYVLAIKKNGYFTADLFIYQMACKKFLKKYFNV